MTNAIVRLQITLTMLRRSMRDDRGDVPGWVLITLMTAGLVTALWAIAGPQLSSLLTEALSGVTGP
ncbi:MAG: hypothetical protein M3P91_04725 [Actinomycetota bacterium]|nr:hypothetical protein [Actinomycetota bacterium]